MTPPPTARIAIVHDYGRTAVVVYPPVETDGFVPTDERSGRFLVVSRPRRHKRLDLAIGTANRHGWPLDVIGDGPDRIDLAGVWTLYLIGSP